MLNHIRGTTKRGNIWGTLELCAQVAGLVSRATQPSDRSHGRSWHVARRQRRQHGMAKNRWKEILGKGAQGL